MIRIIDRIFDRSNSFVASVEVIVKIVIKCLEKD